MFDTIRIARPTLSLRHVMRFALVIVGALALTVATIQLSGVTQAHAEGTWLRYQRGYYLDQGWMCYGWSNGAYHCTQHWYTTSSGALVSTNTAWVPNGLNGSVTQAQTRNTVAQHATPKPAAGSSVAGDIRAVFGPYASQALRVAQCESSLNPRAYNASSGASGVFQFLRSTWATTSYAGSSPFNASANIRAAHQVFVRDGYSWREWSCQP